MRKRVIPAGPVPRPGFHYHFKRKPDQPINSCAYEVIGISWNAENDKEDEEPVVVYRSLYDPSSPIPGTGQALDHRRVSNFFEMVDREGKSVPRFVRVTNPEDYQRLKAIRDQMCSEIKLVPAEAAP